MEWSSKPTPDLGAPPGAAAWQRSGRLASSRADSGCRGQAPAAGRVPGPWAGWRQPRAVQPLWTLLRCRASEGELPGSAQWLRCGPAVAAPCPCGWDACSRRGPPLQEACRQAMQRCQLALIPPLVPRAPTGRQGGRLLRLHVRRRQSRRSGGAQWQRGCSAPPLRQAALLGITPAHHQVAASRGIWQRDDVCWWQLGGELGQVAGKGGAAGGPNKSGLSEPGVGEDFPAFTRASGHPGEARGCSGRFLAQTAGRAGTRVSEVKGAGTLVAALTQQIGRAHV